ncbi:MAG: hypothetical protein H7Y38_13315, partial [Armatimonadetes bacterium]|nr:hypothetical protein [Armatimonadota bacterium]
MDHSSNTGNSPAILTEIAPLEIRLFGSMQIRVAGQPLPRLRSRKGLWLLALLSLRAGRDVERDWIAGTLWPDYRDTDARRSLRQSLHDLRVALGSKADRLACDSPRTLRLDVSTDCFVDTLIFDAAVALPRSEQDATRLEAAVCLYRGSLLEDCAEDWVLGERRQREQQYVAALEMLATGETANARHAVATGYLRLATGVDPLREDLQRALMVSLTAEGNSPAAALVYRRFREHLWREMNTEPDAQTTALYRRLRSVAGTERADTAKKPVRVLSVTTVAEPSSPLPQPRTVLIGREEAVEEVAVCLTRARLVTLTGAGGVGKTRLALQVAEETADDFEGGARFVPLATLTDPSGVPEAVRDALDVAQQGDGAPQPVEELLCHHLASRRLLLVLDNCEHVLTACAALVDTLLSTCPGLRVLCTSREPLRMRGELVWRVPSLAVPPLSATEAEATEYAAVRLFVARAEEADVTFRITTETLPALVRVCRRLDGIPLAIELAATRVRMLTATEIDRRLDDRFRLLTGGDRAA